MILECLIYVSVFKPLCFDSPPLLLFGLFPTPWRSSQVPCPRCSHYLEDQQQSHIILRLADSTFFHISYMQKPQTHRWGHSVKHDLVLPQHWFKLEPFTTTNSLPSSLAQYIRLFTDNANWSLLKDCVLTGRIEGEAIYRNSFSKILKVMLHMQLLLFHGDQYSEKF